MFYKVVQVTDGTTAIIDVLETPLSYVRYQARNKILVLCERNEAMGILSSTASSAWHIEGLSDFPAEAGYSSVELIEIGQQEYEVLKSALDENESVPEAAETHEDPIENATLTLVRNAKIADMRKTCNETITAGVDVALTDGAVHHFDLNMEDQINLMTLEKMAEAGEAAIPYHETGGLCRFYTAEDIMRIVNGAAAFKTFHVSYYNSLCNYIAALEDIGEIDAIRYGDEIPAEYRSEVLTALMQE